MMRVRRRLFAAALAVGLASAAPAEAVEVAPVADTYVDAGKPRFSGGTARLLRVSKAPLRRAFMRFDLERVTGSPARATLHLHLARGRVTIQPLADGARWSERRTTYVRSPDVAGPVLRSRRVRRRGWVHVDVTRLVTVAGRLDLAIAGAPRGSVSSSESAHSPRLTVRVAAPVFAPGPVTPPAPAPPVPAPPAPGPPEPIPPEPTPPEPAPAVVTVVQDSDPDAGRPIRYTGTLGDFALTGDSRQTFTVTPDRLGAVTVAQSPLTGWASAPPICEGDPDVTTTPHSATVVVGSGDAVGCRFAITGPAPIPGIYPETSNEIGPFVDGNGNLYTVTEIATTTPKPAIRKSSDGGRTWTEVDAAHRPTVEDLESVSLAQDGTRIHMIHQRSGYRVYYNSFNTSDAAVNPDAWEVRNQQLFAGSATPKDQSVSLALRRSGELVAFYVIGDTQIAFRERAVGGTWGPQAVLDPDPAGTMLTQVFAEGSTVDDTIHIAYKQHALTKDEPSSIFYRSLSADGVLSRPLTVATNAVSGSSAYKAMPNHGLVVLEAGGEERVHVAWRRQDERLAAAEFAAGQSGDTPPPERVISDSTTYQNPESVESNQVVGALAPDTQTGAVHALYADDATHDLWSDLWTSSWEADRELLDDTDVMAISANVFTHAAAHGGRKVLGIVFDQDTGVAEQGAVHYTEVELPPGP